MVTPVGTGRRETTAGRVRIGGAAVLTLLAVFVVVAYVRRAHPPLVEFESPAAGESIARPQNVGVRLNRPVPEGETVWLGYQNEKGGPFVLQASKCTAIARSLDCGPLYVGHDAKDPAEFRLFLATADDAATTALSAHGPSNPGDNLRYPVLPAGTAIVAQQRRVRLQ